MAGPYTPPKLDTKLLPDLFALVAQSNPQRPFIQIIREHSEKPIDCVRFTWTEVIQHAQNTAEALCRPWTDRKENDPLKELLGQPRKPGSSLVVVGVLANNGYELYVNILACLFNRWTVLLISPKNSPAAIEHLLRTSNASLLLVDTPSSVLGQALERAVPGISVQPLATPSIFTTGSPSFSPAPPTDEQIQKEVRIPALYLHTSGSTSHPKIIPWTHEFILSAIRARIRDNKELTGRTIYCVPPLSLGSLSYLVFPIANANLMTFVSTPIPMPPSAASLVAHLRFIKDGIIILPPSILEDLVSLGGDRIKKLAEGSWMVVFGGAPLKQSIGDALVAAGVNLTAGYGSTEINIGSTHLFDKAPENWEYIYFRDGYEWHFLPVDDHSNLRELIVGPGTDSFPAVINHESPLGFATNDIWEPHPTVPGLWKHHSRKSDVTVLGNGEKSDNRQIENLLLRDTRIRHVLVFGTGRPMNGVIIQPTDVSISPSAFLEKIQPTVGYANSILPKHSKIIPELIIVATADKTIPKTEKGTIKKQNTLEVFRQEIEAAYAVLEKGLGREEWTFRGNLYREEDLRAFVREAVWDILGKKISDEDDLFESGFDSLLAIRLRSAILSVTNKTACEHVPSNVVYTFPTIDSLTKFLLACVTHGAYDNKREDEVCIRKLIERYSSGFIPHVPGSTMAGAKAVALSGSTGSVGSSVLRTLLERQDVCRVYLLNRRGERSQKSRHIVTFNRQGLDPKILDTMEGTIVYLDVDFSEKDLGLKASEYEDLRCNVTHIIHAAWHLNFNLVLESYKNVHIAGVRHLIDLALSSPHKQPPRITFLSTVAAVGKYHGISQKPPMGEHADQVIVPEAPIDDPSVPLDQGYAQSKYVGERILVNAAQAAGLRVTIVRAGQLSGSTTNGAWTASEYVPIIIVSSIALGMVPDDLSPVRWVPSDIAASAIIKQAFEDTSKLEYFSAENPFTTPWSVVVRALLSVSPTPLRQTALTVWLDYLRRYDVNPEEVPAVKLVDFYQHLAQRRPFDVALGWEKSVKVAPELVVGSMSIELVEKYVLYQLRSIGRL